MTHFLNVKVAQIASSVVQGWRNDCLVACDAGALCHRHYAYQTLPRRLSTASAIQRSCRCPLSNDKLAAQLCACFFIVKDSKLRVPFGSQDCRPQLRRRHRTSRLGFETKPMQATTGRFLECFHACQLRKDSDTRSLASECQFRGSGGMDWLPGELVTDGERVLVSLMTSQKRS